MTDPLIESNISPFLVIFQQDLTYDKIEETEAYTLIALLCDIGGSLGFVLGISLLTILEIVDATFNLCILTGRKIWKRLTV